MSDIDPHKHSKMIRKKVRQKRNLKTRLKNKLSFSLGKEKIIYIIIGIILAALVAKALIWYIQKTEESASLNIHQYATSGKNEILSLAGLRVCPLILNLALKGGREERFFSIVNQYEKVQQNVKVF